MASLFSEYCRRHGVSYISPMGEGLLFLQRDEKPAAILLVSSHTKSIIYCPYCNKLADKLIVEICVPYLFPVMFQVTNHEHIDSESNLLDYLNKFKDYTPYVPSGERDNERWLWQYFLNINKMSRNVLKSMPSKQSWLAEIFWLAKNNPDMYKTFYNNLYSIIMINRIYLLKG